MVSLLFYVTLLTILFFVSISGFSRSFRLKSFSTTISMSTTSFKTSLPPSTFIECARKAAECTSLAIESGERLMEVEFPPLPLEYLEDSSSSARAVSDANSRWALEFATKLSSSYGKVSIIYPDQPELDDGIKYINSPNLDNPAPNVTLATIRVDSIKNAQSLDQVLLSIFGATIGGKVESIPDTKIYVAIISSAQELPDLEKLHSLNPTIPLILFNLKLDQLVNSSRLKYVHLSFIIS